MDNHEAVEVPKKTTHASFMSGSDPDFVPPVEHSPSKLRYFWPFFIFCVVLSVVGVGAYMIDAENKQNPSLVGSLLTPTPNLPKPSLTPTPDPTIDWNTYSNSLYSIKYPKSDNVTNEAWEHVESESDVSFGPPVSKSGGYYWGIFSYENKEIEELIAESGEQFSDRKEKRKNITINGRTALLVTVTTQETEDWVSKNVYLEDNRKTASSSGKIYVISNGATDIPYFEAFYNSFSLIQ
jgi:hypothetical protein